MFVCFSQSAFRFECSSCSDKIKADWSFIVDVYSFLFVADDSFHLFVIKIQQTNRKQEVRLTNVQLLSVCLDASGRPFLLCVIFWLSEKKRLKYLFFTSSLKQNLESCSSTVIRLGATACFTCSWKLLNADGKMKIPFKLLQEKLHSQWLHCQPLLDQEVVTSNDPPQQSWFPRKVLWQWRFNSNLLPGVPYFYLPMLHKMHEFYKLAWQGGSNSAPQEA